jgi:hypothetical protein
MKVGGGFYCYECSNLTSLVGAPEKVGGSFNCSDCNNLTSLEGAPKEVGGDFVCSRCHNLTSAHGLPLHIDGNIMYSSDIEEIINDKCNHEEKEAKKSKNNGFFTKLLKKIGRE